MVDTVVVPGTVKVMTKVATLPARSAPVDFRSCTPWYLQAPTHPAAVLTVGSDGAPPFL